MGGCLSLRGAAVKEAPAAEGEPAPSPPPAELPASALGPLPRSRGNSARDLSGGSSRESSQRSGPSTPQELRRSFELAARELPKRNTRFLTRSSGGNEPAALRHPEACPPCPRRPRPARYTTALALGEDANGDKCVNQYVRQRRLANGSYGKVALYESRPDGRQFAVKVLNKPQLERKYVSRNVNALTDALNEIALLRALDHPNIVRLEEVIDDPNEDKVYVVMEFLSGGPIYVEGNPPLSHADAARAVSDACSALSFLHWQGVAHGDVKPDNLLTGGDGAVRLLDFSVSQNLGGTECGSLGSLDDGEGGGAEAGEAPGARMSNEVARTPGTPAYTAPECCRGGPFDGVAADVWALGATLYTLLAGRPPFVGESLMVLYARIQEQPLTLPAGVGEEAGGAGELLGRMLDKDPRKRATLAEVRAHPWVTAHCGPPPPQPGEEEGAAAQS